jgi:1,4-dihydroxy-2-naphthoyl-CoA hydrolase
VAPGRLVLSRRGGVWASRQYPLSVVTEDISVDLEAIRSLGEGLFPGLLGIEVLDIRRGETRMRLSVERKHIAPNGFLHAGAVVGLADTACGYGCRVSLPEAATGFATVELKTNFLGTALDGSIVCNARLVHGGRTTQVWDAEVTDEDSGKKIALFRCTQLVLYPRS